MRYDHGQTHERISEVQIENLAECDSDDDDADGSWRDWESIIGLMTRGAKSENSKLRQELIMSVNLINRNSVQVRLSARERYEYF